MLRDKKGGKKLLRVPALPPLLHDPYSVAYKTGCLIIAQEEETFVGLMGAFGFFLVLKLWLPAVLTQLALFTSPGTAPELSHPKPARFNRKR